MDSGPAEETALSRGVSRRQMIAGSGIAAAAWAAPSIVRLDVASAAGSGSTLTTVLPSSVPAGVSVVPAMTATSMIEPVFGEYGRFNDEGNTVRFSFNSPPAHTSITVTVRICYESNWEQSGNGADTMDIQVDGVSPVGFPTSNVGLNDQCINYMLTEPHTGALDIDVFGFPVALAENFGVARVDVEFC